MKQQPLTGFDVEMVCGLQKENRTVNPEAWHQWRNSSSHSQAMIERLCKELDDMAKIYITIYFLILVDTI